LLPTPSCPTGCPVPHTLNARSLGQPRLLLTLRVRPARQTLRPWGQPHLGSQLGAPRVGPTWDQPRKAPFHRHGLGPAGVLAEEGPPWVPTPPPCLCPVRGP
jgi:hypothetical protein